MSILKASVGQALTPLVKPPVEQAHLGLYAEASGDHNPIHLDAEAAHRVGLEGIIAHGMLSMAFLGQFVYQQIADDPGARVASLKVRYVGQVRPGDTLTCLGKVKAREETGAESALTLECWVQNQHATQVTTGEAQVFLHTGQ